jgi:hypothetical protein
MMRYLIERARPRHRDRLGGSSFSDYLYRNLLILASKVAVVISEAMQRR